MKCLSPLSFNFKFIWGAASHKRPIKNKGIVVSEMHLHKTEGRNRYLTCKSHTCLLVSLYCSGIQFPCWLVYFPRQNGSPCPVANSEVISLHYENLLMQIRLLGSRSKKDCYTDIIVQTLVSKEGLFWKANSILSKNKIP
jgi:hypothetical protein